MMIIMQSVFQILILAVGFGAGYWLIITANSQEGTIKNFGQALGGVLIVMALILEIFSCYYAMQIGNRDYMQSGCPVQRVINQGGTGVDTEDENYNNSDIKPSTDTENSQDLPVSKNVPVKRDIKDHE